MEVNSLIHVESNPNVPEVIPGDTVRVSSKVLEGNREHNQVFEGIVIRVRKRGPSSNFTVRRISYGIGVEKTFLVYSPRLNGVEVVRHGKTRRAKLYYLRGRVGKAIRLKEKSPKRQEKASQ